MKPIDLDITRGETFKLVVQWETDPTIYKPITAISNTAPVRLTVTGHGMVEGRKAAVTNAIGLTELNATPNRIRERDRHAVTVIDADTIEFNDVDATGFGTYASGGILQYQTPGDLSAYTRARDSFKARAGVSNRLICTTGGTAGATKPTAAGTDGTAVWAATTAAPTTTEWVAGATYVAGEVIDLETLLWCSTENGRLTVNDTTKEISYLISANDAALITWNRAVHELEVIKPGLTFVSDEVVKLSTVSTVTIHKEGTH